MHIVFQSLDYDDFTDIEDLIDIYLWKPAKAGMKPATTISKKGIVSTKRKRSFTKPTKTARTGLVTSRVGQGYFRNQLIEKYDNRCAVTDSELHSILIASHIVPWKSSSEAERLDENNGILLSPVYDALFDKHLISFQDDGKIIISNSIIHEMGKLGVNPDAKIVINEEMKPYLKRHRDQLN